MAPRGRLVPHLCDWSTAHAVQSLVILMISRSDMLSIVWDCRAKTRQRRRRAPPTGSARRGLCLPPASIVARTCARQPTRGRQRGRPCQRRSGVRHRQRRGVPAGLGPQRPHTRPSLPLPTVATAQPRPCCRPRAGLRPVERSEPRQSSALPRQERPSGVRYPGNRPRTRHEHSVQRFSSVVTQFAVQSGVTTLSESAANCLSCPGRRAQSRLRRPAQARSAALRQPIGATIRYDSALQPACAAHFASLQPRSEPARATPPSSLSAACADPSGTPAPDSRFSSRRGKDAHRHICPRVRRGNFRTKIRKKGSPRGTARHGPFASQSWCLKDEFAGVFPCIQI